MTSSRRSEPRVWLRAVAWLVGAGLHLRAGVTTLVVARDLADRMDYTEGTVLYDLAGTADRCGVSTATVKRHVRYLRELGALAWVRHGSRRNLRLPGRLYAGTATIYAATVPKVFDEAMGHQIGGTGYEARVIGMTEQGQTRAVDTVRTKAGSVDNRKACRAGSVGRAPQSLGRHHPVRKAEVSGGLKDTSRGRSARSKKTPPTPLAATGRSHGRHPHRVARDIDIARQVRPLVPWVQREGLRRLAHSLRPLIDRGLDSHTIAAELHGLVLGWRPARPAAFITAALASQTAADATREADHHGAVAPASNAAWQQWLRTRETPTQAVRTDNDRQHARLYSWDRWQEIAAHYDDDPDDALDLYGTKLCTYAVGRAERP